LPKIQSR